MICFSSEKDLLIYRKKLFKDGGQNDIYIN